MDRSVKPRLEMLSPLSQHPVSTIFYSQISLMSLARATQCERRRERQFFCRARASAVSRRSIETGVPFSQLGKPLGQPPFVAILIAKLDEKLRSVLLRRSSTAPRSY